MHWTGDLAGWWTVLDPATLVGRAIGVAAGLACLERVLHAVGALVMSWRGDV